MWRRIKQIYGKELRDPKKKIIFAVSSQINSKNPPIQQVSGFPDPLANRVILDIDQLNLVSLLDSCGCNTLQVRGINSFWKTDIDQSTSSIISIILLHRPCLGTATAYRPPLEIPAQWTAEEQGRQPSTGPGGELFLTLFYPADEFKVTVSRDFL
jgi:hypothetical protein